MSRKVTLSISALLMVIDLSVTAALLKSGERRLAASVAIAAAIVELAHGITNPIPRL